MTKKAYYPNPEQNFDFAKSEEEILKFWQENKIFEKSIENRNFAGIDDEDDSTSPSGCCDKPGDHNHNHNNEFVFYDGPPFANGLPHYGHLLTGYIKDIFARYQTMKGKKVERKFGWDTHGLPVEMEVEKELGVSGQIAIKEFGIEKFNAACQTSVMKYANNWKEYVSRQGRWVDFDHGYKTMDINYMESVIWAFKQLYDKGLVYEDFKVVPYSWACQTPLSNFETRMDNSYRRKESKAVTVKFEVTDKKFGDEKTYLLAWTTTPWTLPSNLALAIGKNIDYVVVRHCEPEGRGNPSIYILGAGCLLKYEKELQGFEIIKKVKGDELLGLSYKPLFSYFTNHEKIKNNSKAFTVLHGDFVSTEDGTGIVHMAPGFGEDDQLLCKANGIPTLCPIDEGGKFTSEMFDLDNLSIKGKQVFETNDDIIKYLKAQNSWLKTEQYFHNYPHCWRTDTPLIYRALPSWYVKVTDIKDRMVEINSGKVLNTESERLIWKFADEKYLDELTALYSDPDVKKFYYYADHQFQDREQTLEAIQYYKDQFEKYGLPRYALFEKSSDKFVGTAGLSFYDPAVENFKNGKVEISYLLTKESWGNAYGAEINSELKTLAFTKFPLESIWASTLSDNLPSQKLLEKTGFKLIEKSNYRPKGSKVKKYECFDYEFKKSDWARPNKINPKYLNPGINWIPEHIKDGQFGKWLEGARDWSITRNRFWGCPVPVWRSDNPEYPRLDVYGSLEEIERDFGVRPDNLHRPFIDELTRPNPNDPSGKSKMVRVTDVLDCWFESGSMPYAQAHYPFENKEWFENNFPADFITEYVAQTRGWFYTLIVLSTALFDKAPFKNVICHGTILDEQSQKLSKRLKNYADPLEIFSTYGSDAMRFYMVSQPVMKGQELRIDKEGKAIKDTSRLFIKPLVNAYNFFCLYANADGLKASRINDSSQLTNIMDRYILAKLKSAVNKIDSAMKNYDTPSAAEQFSGFFEALNNWYIRRNRQRFWKSTVDADKQQAYDTLYTALLTICEAAAPLLPFTTEKVWRDLNNVKE